VIGGDLIELSAAPIAVNSSIASVNEPAAGGIAVFLGITRSEISDDGRALLALDYEAYADMARTQLAELAQQARERWPICRLAILHRTGRVDVGQPSVLIAVSTPHRAEAFEACRWLIDALKASAAIWKKEIWSDGSSTWVHPHL
jgi:molybdopterin synthase catalytic subunit